MAFVEQDDETTDPNWVGPPGAQAAVFTADDVVEPGPVVWDRLAQGW